MFAWCRNAFFFLLLVVLGGPEHTLYNGTERRCLVLASC
jgi:hypothetical protein